MAELTLEQAKQFYPTAVGDSKVFLESNFPDIGISLLPELIKVKWAFEKVGKSFDRFMSLYNSRLASLKSDYEGGIINSGEYADEVLTLNHGQVLRALEVVCEAKNEGWVPNWDDEDERKWYAWFSLVSPFRFADAYCRHTNTYAGCASRLFLQSEKAAIEVANDYLDLWEFYMMK